jgi:hypothetical protein
MFSVAAEGFFALARILLSAFWFLKGEGGDVYRAHPFSASSVCSRVSVIGASIAEC